MKNQLREQLNSKGYQIELTSSVGSYRAEQYGNNLNDINDVDMRKEMGARSIATNGVSGAHQSQYNPGEHVLHQDEQ